MKLKMMRTWILLATFLITGSAFAYIPDYKMIMSRVAENHGRGLYSIEQDVIFPQEPTPLIVRETWLVKDGEALRVSVKGRGGLEGKISGTFVYDGSKRYYKDSGGTTKVSKTSEDWFEPFFHFRWSKRIKPRMVSLNMAPAESLKEREFKDTEDGVIYTPQPWVRLSRVGGSITYGIGTPSPAGAEQLNPGVWIEQDQFVVRKVRFPSQAEIEADQYSRYPYDLWLPKVRSVNWDSKSAKIQLIKVNKVSRSSKNLSRLSPKSLKSNKSASPIELPDNDVIREFYTRFR